MILSNPFSNFLKLQQTRTNLNLPPIILEQLEFEQNQIRKEFNAPKQSNKRNKQAIYDEYINSFRKLSKNEMVELYKIRIETLARLMNKNIKGVDSAPIVQIETYFKTQIMKTWKRKYLSIDPVELTFTIEKQGIQKIHNICNYICRKPQNTDYFSFALEATNGKVKEKYNTIHLGFSSAAICNQVFDQIKKVIQYGITLDYAHKLGIPLSPQIIQRMNRQQNRTEPSSPTRTPQKSAKVDLFLEEDQDKLSQSKIVSQIINQNVYLKNLNEAANVYRASNPHIIEQLLPTYDLTLLTSQDGFQTIICENSYRILQDRLDKTHFKIFLTVQIQISKLFSIITNVQDVKRWNSQIQEFEVKNVVKSENISVMYMKLKSYGSMYRGRDYLFLRHAFNKADSLYLIDKSIQNESYPPLLGTVRAKMTAVWGFIKNKQSNQTLVALDIKIDNEGIVNQNQNTNLTLRYLQKLGNLQHYILEKTTRGDQFISQLFDIKWAIRNRQKVKINIPKSGNFPKTETKRGKAQKSRNIQNVAKSMKEIELQKYDKNLFPISIQQVKDNPKFQKSIIMDIHQGIPEPEIQNKLIEQSRIRSRQVSFKEKSFYENNSIMKKSRIIQQLDPVQIQRISKQKTNYWTPPLNAEGMAIINWNCLNVQHKMIPWYRSIIIDEDYREHHIWKGEWKHDDKQGGLFYKDQSKMAAQKKVLGFIVKKMGSNLISGKGITSISLPVDVFSTQSNLERIARTFAFAPLILQKIAKMEDAVEQMKSVVIMNLTHQLLYMSMEKPFNPVLGETFQGSINGCPVFLEQISHHPPIAAYYFVGRGYKIYGSMQSKMNIGVNSGTGTNEGDFVIHFDNGNIIKFRTPGGEISGLTFGDRKLNLVGKGYFWSPNRHLMLQVTYNPNKKGFFSVGKQETPSDYFSGTIKKVTKQFIQKFQSDKNKPSATKKDILQQYSVVCGVWTRQIIIDGRVVFVVDRQKYLKFQYESNPLPSDANYRQDVIYKRLGDLQRSQKQKQRIEEKQRGDRKMREKIHGKKH